MSSSDSESQIQTWLENLASERSKHHEAAALAIAGAPTFDERIVRGLELVAVNDPKEYARDAALLALAKIAEAHFQAGNDLRALLANVKAGTLAPKALRAAKANAEVSAPVSPLEEETEPVDAPTIGVAAATEGQTLARVESVVPTTGASMQPNWAPSPIDAGAPVMTARAQPPNPAIPFDQWLLSERNIKLALYAGGLLLLLAGLIFVGVNWAYLPGIAKLGVTLAVTLSMYAGGLILFQRPALRIGGVALLAIASGFLPLNFVVTHLYMTGTRGGRVEPIWLVASLLCGAVYLGTTLWSKHNLFTVLTVLGLLSGVTALIALVQAGSTGAALVYALVALGILLLAYGAVRNARAQFMARTLRIAAHVLAPITFMYAISAWASTSFHTPNSWWGAFAAGLVIVVFYAMDDWRRHSLYARWCAAFGFAITAVFVCFELGFSSIQTGLVLKVLAAVYLVLGRYLQGGKKIKLGLPLYSVGAVLAVFVTAQATLAYLQTPEHLALALVGDVALLSLGAFLFRRYELLYGATWLLIVPVSIYGNRYLADRMQVALGLSGLMLGYAASGYFIGGARLAWGGSFLSAAALLSLLAPALLIPNYLFMIGLLLSIALLYGLFAVWLRWSWLTLAALIALHLAALAGVLSVVPFRDDIVFVSGVVYVVLGLALVAGAVELKRRGLSRWRLPFYLVASGDLAIAFGLAGSSNEALVVAVAVAIAVVSFALQWVEREGLERLKLPPVMSYLGALAALTAVIYAARVLGIPPEYEPVQVAIGSAALVGIGLVLRQGSSARFYGVPLRYVGLVFSVAALAWTIYYDKPLLGAAVYGIAALTYGIDGFARKQMGLVYASGAALVGTLWWLLRYSDVRELQAHALPLGILCLLVGWSEARRGRIRWFQVATIAGLIVILGSVFYQSLFDIPYAVLFLVEGAAAFALGVRMRSRIYVEAAIAALFANGLAQFGPAFINLERWIQIGTVGSLLLLGGLAALFRRRRLLELRQALASEWKMWKP